MLLNGCRIGSLLSALLICWFSGGFQSLHWLWILPVSFAGTYFLLFCLLFVFLLIICKRVDISVPQEHDSPFYRKALQLYVDAALGILKTRFHTRGLEKIPTDGRFLVVCNHLDIMDPVILLKFFSKHQLAFISKRENANMFIVGKMMHKTMCQMINRENNREGLKTILTCIRLLKEDEVSIAVFPEGYTSLDVKLHHFRSGVFKIATKAKVPIVVCTVENSQSILRSSAKLKPVDVNFHVLDVIRPEQYEGMTAVEISSRIYDLMLEDLGPAYIPDEEPEEAE